MVQGSGRRAAAALNHPNILAIHDSGTERGIAYVVSELLEGETLRERLQLGPLSLRKTVDLTLQITSGLAAAHEKGIVHRDLKPENLFLTKDGRIKILDFGLAKLVSTTQTSGSVTKSLTGDGVIMGTAGYMPPEQVRGQATDQRADIFALGAIVYEMLSARRAFQGDSAADTITAILTRDPEPLRAMNPTIPPAFERLVHRCLEKDPNQRFHSVRDVAFALEAISDVPATSGSDVAARDKDRPSRSTPFLLAGLLALLAVTVIAGALYFRSKRGPSSSQEWEKVTSFSDSVTAPALSPDGRMLAFVRNQDTFVGVGDVYLKMLPNGEPVQLTHDDQMKTNPVFSPDGSRIAYTTAPPWDTWVVPTLGGKPQKMLPNASGLGWVDERHILFSEIKEGIHMAVVTGTESRAEKRDVYVPTPQDGMAHRSYLSPDRKWVLVASEMNASGNQPCRLVPFDGSTSGRIVGPAKFECSYAGWSPDGNWMYFSSNDGVSGFHLWRQRFPDGQPEQFTFGPTEQEGIAVEASGHSLLTAVGLTTSTVAVHDKSGEREIAFEGHAWLPASQFGFRQMFSPDGSKIYFFGSQHPGDAPEIWSAELDSGLAERSVPGIPAGSSYDVSPDGKQIVFDSRDQQGQPRIWIASLDRNQPPRQLGSRAPESSALFGPKGDLYFQSDEGGNAYLYRRNLANGETQKVVSAPIVRLHTLSADGQWAVAEAPIPSEQNVRALVAYRLADGKMLRVCHGLCTVRWTLDGKYLHIILFRSHNATQPYTTYIVPLRRGESFPQLPAGGIEKEEDVAGLPGAKVIPGLAYPGGDEAHYAFSRGTVQRNIYRIPIP
jgi:Tol biopolymer transport system component